MAVPNGDAEVAAGAALRGWIEVTLRGWRLRDGPRQRDCPPASIPWTYPARRADAALVRRPAPPASCPQQLTRIPRVRCTDCGQTQGATVVVRAALALRGHGHPPGAWPSPPSCCRPSGHDPRRAARRRGATARASCGRAPPAGSLAPRRSLTWPGQRRLVEALVRSTRPRLGRMDRPRAGVHSGRGGT